MAKTICDVCAKRSFCVVKSEFYPVVKCGNYENTNDTITKVEQTNEEWLKSMKTEELAEWIYCAMFYKSCQKDVEDGAYMQMMTKKDYIENWLMEKHDEPV